MLNPDEYRQFAGRHWETGTVANFFAGRGVIAPNTGRPYSEALLLGVSGGAGRSQSSTTSRPRRWSR